MMFIIHNFIKKRGGKRLKNSGKKIILKNSKKVLVETLQEPIFAPHLKKNHGRFVYRLGHLPFTEERRVRFPYRLPIPLMAGFFILYTFNKNGTDALFYALTKIIF